MRGLNTQKELDFGEKIDVGAIDKTLLTKKENIHNLIKMIDKENEKLEQNAFFETLDKSKQITKEIINFADKTNRDLSENEIAEIING